MGHDGSLYEIAQWYPRMAVYDDVRGWNHEPYIGGGEFYLEYGSFDVALTVPADYIVGGDGRAAEPGAGAHADAARPARARARRSTRAGRDHHGRRGRASRRGRGPRPTGTLTWRFTADSVRDFAFGGGAGLPLGCQRRTTGHLVHTLYRPSAPEWEEANRMVRDAIKYFSEQWYRYPYPHITSIEGPIEGMEYPDAHLRAARARAARSGSGCSPTSSGTSGCR